ncbi:prepilin-type N-terminal cleavage/methylation domain-containing protein [Indioceanicola profundi]|uniref:prepilin-type N-terminal cleavage/methylation domain-containing protein n=1 Tax=Indioceanicola profundi TaxID=2220096 RepID=UPI000E6AE299|nr:prepilin-type N-terminal cleavage/methylation domain-containing protein [Indioceanicola profundi]
MNKPFWTDPREQGFTLVELLVAMLLLSLLGVVLAAAFQLATNHVGRYADRLDGAGRLAAAQSFLRTRIAAADPAVPISWSGDIILFDGAADHLSFVGPAPQSVPAGGLQVYAVTANERGLVITWQPYTGLPPGKAERETVLHAGIISVRFAYFGRVRDEAGLSWHNSWRDATALPLLVRIDMADADGNVLPSVLAAPRISR